MSPRCTEVRSQERCNMGLCPSARDGFAPSRVLSIPGEERLRPGEQGGELGQRKGGILVLTLSLSVIVIFGGIFIPIVGGAWLEASFNESCP